MVVNSGRGRPVPWRNRHRHRRLNPAAGSTLTGIVGIKPTYGLCSRSGIIACASSLDPAGRW
jgi:hypothetical protein